MFLLHQIHVILTESCVFLTKSGRCSGSKKMTYLRSWCSNLYFRFSNSCLGEIFHTSLVTKVKIVVIFPITSDVTWFLWRAAWFLRSPGRTVQVILAVGLVIYNLGLVIHARKTCNFGYMSKNRNHFSYYVERYMFTTESCVFHMESERCSGLKNNTFVIPD